MTRKQAERYYRLREGLMAHGITQDQVDILLRCSKRLHTWCEHEANGAIQRDETTNKPYWYSTATGEKIGTVRDMETGAKNRITAILESNKSGLAWYYQTDCRGCAVYILRPGDVPQGCDPAAYYNRGLAVCID